MRESTLVLWTLVSPSRTFPTNLSSHTATREHPVDGNNCCTQHPVDVHATQGYSKDTKGYNGDIEEICVLQRKSPEKHWGYRRDVQGFEGCSRTIYKALHMLNMPVVAGAWTLKLQVWGTVWSLFCNSVNTFFLFKVWILEKALLLIGRELKGLMIP